MKARVFALYLPQFHPIPENDRWWGKGFTEWTNVAKAKPLFKGHRQPRIPADLGFYDLRMPEVREQQAELARQAGIEAFCYYHYWFGEGKQLLERPFNEVLASGKPDFPFCLCWANHTWSNKTWERKGALSQPQVLMEQRYLGYEDNVQHFLSVLPAFQDKRYVTIDGKPVFTIYDPYAFPHIDEFISTWRDLAVQHGLPGIFFIGMTPSTLTFKMDANGERTRCLPNLESSADLFNYVLSLGFDAVNSLGMRRGEMLYEGKYKNVLKVILRKVFGIQTGSVKYDYAKTVGNYFAPEDAWENVYPTILPGWDRSPRIGMIEGVYVHSTPQAFETHIRQALKLLENKAPQHKVLFLKSWNEWGEGNYVEPDLHDGHGYLDALRNVLQ